ncbi:MAG: FAD:protein FMN transferase [Actinomycetota bacterium]
MISGPARVSFPALGSTATVVTPSADHLSTAVEQVEHEVCEIDRTCSRFRADSDLSRVNADPGRWVRVDDRFLEALKIAIEAARATGGGVDPTVGRAMEAIGYDRDFSLVPGAGRRGKAPIGVPARGCDGIELDAERGRVRIPVGVMLDLGATAKALAADHAAARASAAAGCGVMVSLGGDIAVAGASLQGGWTIGIAEDHRSTPEVGETISIIDGGVATSSTAVRRWAQGGTQVHHVIDPRTGLPAPEVWRTVTVAAASCVGANVASTNAVVIGDAALPWLDALRLSARLVAANGQITRLRWPERSAA